MGYLRKTVVGISWMGAFRIALRGIGFLKIALIARILVPSEFGLFGIASIVLGLTEILTETGVNVFLIQEKDKVDKYVNTAWVVSIARGIIIALLIALFAPLIASFYKTPSALPVILAISIIPFIRGFINPSIVKFQKDLQFNKDFILKTSMFAVDGAVSVVLVYLTKSPMALVWGMAAGALAELVVSHLMVLPRPGISFEKEQIREIISRGKWVTFYGIFDYLFSNADNLIVGKVFGIGALGLYDMGYKVSILPATEISNVVARVTFPVYVQISHEVPRLKKAFLKTIGIIALVGIPIAAAFFFFPELLVKIVLGDKWLGVAHILRILALFGLMRAISACANPVFLSLRKQNYLAAITFINIVVLLATIFPFMNIYGLVGAAYAALLTSVISFFVTFYLAFRALR